MHSKTPITALTINFRYLGKFYLYKDSFELQILNTQILKQREFRITISILW